MSDPLVPVATGLTIWNMLCGEGPVSRGLGKLVDTISDQFGQGAQSANDWIRAKSRASVKLTEARAEIAAEQLKIQGDHGAKLLKMRLGEESAATWHEIQQKRRERNVEKVLNQTAEELRSTPDSEVSDKKVDPDWTTQFFNHAQDVSNEDMQRLWARLLAGEVRHPGTFSSRTLSVVKSLVKEEGDLFGKLCSFIWQQLPGSGLVVLLGESWLEENSALLGFNYADCIRLEECGLIRLEPLGAGLNFTGRKAFFQYFSTGFLFEKNEGVAASQLMLRTGPFLLTTTGQDLARIASSSPNSLYLDAILASVREQGWVVHPAHADIIDDKTIKYSLRPI